MNTPSKRAWVIQACLFNVDKVCNEMTMWLVEQGLTSCLFQVELMAREALNNAIIHGSNLDPDRSVNCELQFIEDQLRLTVQDDGPGFDWHSLLENEVVDSLQENGRGIQMYRFYADSIEFNPSGNQVTLVRRFKRN